MYNLFTKFPVIYYNGQLAVNIISKVKFTEAAKRAAANYYPYTISEGERPDIIAANYYEDSRYSWLIYMVNDIIDPVYDWPLMQDEFNAFIVKKYGSIEKAMDGIAFWRVNWYEDETTLTAAGYEALPSYAKKYFVPISNIAGSSSYVRSKIDYASETNIIEHIVVSSTAGFIVGEMITQTVTGNLSATAVIKSIIEDTNTLVVNNVLGTFVPNEYIDGKDSGSRSTASSITTTAISIPPNERVYWTYVSYYDYEMELNEQKRHIKLLDRAYVDQVEKELDNLL